MPVRSLQIRRRYLPIAILLLGLALPNSSFANDPAARTSRYRCFLRTVRTLLFEPSSNEAAATRHSPSDGLIERFNVPAPNRSVLPIWKEAIQEWETLNQEFATGKTTRVSPYREMDWLIDIIERTKKEEPLLPLTEARKDSALVARERTGIANSFDRVKKLADELQSRGSIDLKEFRECVGSVLTARSNILYHQHKAQYMSLVAPDSKGYKPENLVSKLLEDSGGIALNAPLVLTKITSETTPIEVFNRLSAYPIYYEGLVDGPVKYDFEPWSTPFKYYLHDIEHARASWRNVVARALWGKDWASRFEPVGTRELTAHERDLVIQYVRKNARFVEHLFKEVDAIGSASRRNRIEAVYFNLTHEGGLPADPELFLETLKPHGDFDLAYPWEAAWLRVQIKRYLRTL